MAAQKLFPAIDVHSHVYLPRYMDVLRARNVVPRVLAGVDTAGDERLVILPGEDVEKTTATGRPIGGEFWDPARKLAFMDTHGIEISVLSFANPWLDFIETADAAALATLLNDDMHNVCTESNGRFYGFGVLPTTDPSACAAELRRIMTLDKMRGIILSTRGFGAGLDDTALESVWAAAEETEATVFIHPHYGIGQEHLKGTGHTLPLALGFPFETTAAVSRLILSGTLDRHPRLQLLIAHAGSALPALAGRLDACAATDYSVDFKLRHPPSHYLKMMTFDAIAYTPGPLRCLTDLVGPGRVMFGSDHPFFAPRARGPAMDALPWETPTATRAAVAGALDPAAAEAVLSGNARTLLRL